MTAAGLPHGVPVAVVGAMSTEEQAEEALQMRFVLAWSLRLTGLVRAQRPGASRSTPPM